MFDLFKNDIKINDKVKLYLTTGKEPEGVVLAIGDNFVLLQSDTNTQNRFFDKLIGGWDVIKTEASKSSILKIEESKIEINQIYLIEKANLLRSSLEKKILEKRIEPNANIIEVRGTTCIASNRFDPKLLIINNRIVDDNLISEIEIFKTGSIIPVVLNVTTKESKNFVNAVVLPNSLGYYINLFIHLIEHKQFHQASVLFFIIKNELKFNRYINDILIEIKKAYKSSNFNDVKKIEVQVDHNNEEKRVFKKVEKEINDLIRQSKFELAISQIDKELISGAIDNKYKSSLLLKKAQIYSSLNNPDDSERAYQALVNFNEQTKASTNNLSHLYTELARLQALKADKQLLALESVKKAIQYNPNNSFANTLLKHFEGKTGKIEYGITENESENDYLLIESDDDTGTISKMIDLDIKEHKYSHPDIIREGGKPTAFIAKQILDEAKRAREADLSERYPIYLEAAKSFSELNVGSYNLQDYLESVAYYAMLKGNSLFINFKNSVFNNELDITKLVRLRDSACSYYIESLNLLSNIEPKLLITILANYIKLNIVTYLLENKITNDLKQIFKGHFADIFNYCIDNTDDGITALGLKAIIDCGSNSINAWNKLAYNVPKYKVNLNKVFSTDRIIRILNLLINYNITPANRPNIFLSKIFQARKISLNELSSYINGIDNIEFSPTNFKSIRIEFFRIENLKYLLTKTDNDSFYEIDKMLSLLEPYLNRAQTERTNIIIQARKTIEKQIKFINQNATYFGRTLFYPLLVNWKSEIDILLEEKIAQSYPLLTIWIDPPYYIHTDGEITAPLVIKNEGKATSEGFSLKITCESTEYVNKIEIPYESNVEISAESKVEMIFSIPLDILRESKAIEISIDVEAKYQKKNLPSKNYQFTIEEEPQSALSYDDIPWRDGPIPPEHLFKGRKKLIADLAQHYLSVEKDKPYILYGLTRTGKSSVLEYLKKDIAGDSFYFKGRTMRVLTFGWDLSVAASFKKASDFWEYILYQQTFEELDKYTIKYDFNTKGLNIKENVRAKDFRTILDYLHTKNLYPIFFIDEFSFIKTLIDDGTINSAFLHTLRQFSLGGLASFIFAGTYDIKALIKNPVYGITGQLVNTIEEQVNEISDEAAEELIEVINEKLTFTPEAVEHIKFLSGKVPYFIQIICKHCGYYAAENKRRHIGYPELEKVIKILIGQEPSSPKSLVKKLPENTFQNNQFSPADPKEVAVLISSITYLNKDRVEDPRGVGFADLQKLWADKKINAFRPKLADSINLLKEKRIIVQEEDEEIPVYKLSVDLFRRWWTIHHPDINLTLTTLIED